jgi:folate-binding protein YgfZ
MPESAATVPESVLEGVRTLGEFWPEVGLIEVTGADRLAWLQGQSTNDLRSVSSGIEADFCVCRPTGQMLAVCRLWEVGDRAYLAAEAACLPAVLERFETMVVMEDVAARDATPLFPPATALSKAPEARRLCLGIPLRGVDWDEKTLPPELGPGFEASHVSYTKGCYTGQEVLMRIHSRGHTNRTWMGLIAGGPIAPGDVVEHESRAEAGRVTSAAVSPELGWIGAAMLRNEAAREGSKVKVRPSDGLVSAIARHFPM